MAAAARSLLPMEDQLRLLSRSVEDCEVVQAAVAAGHASWEQLHELLTLGVGWPERRTEEAIDAAIDRGMIVEHVLGHFRVVEAGEDVGAGWA